MRSISYQNDWAAVSDLSLSQPIMNLQLIDLLNNLSSIFALYVNQSNYCQLTNLVNSFLLFNLSLNPHLFQKFRFLQAHSPFLHHTSRFLQNHKFIYHVIILLVNKKDLNDLPLFWDVLYPVHFHYQKHSQNLLYIIKVIYFNVFPAHSLSQKPLKEFYFVKYR